MCIILLLGQPKVSSKNPVFNDGYWTILLTYYKNAYSYVGRKIEKVNLKVG